MGQVIELDRWRRRGQPVPTSADAGLPSRQASPSALADLFLLPSIVLALWRSYAAACAGWWLAPMGLVVRPAKASASAAARPRARLSTTS
jgi:hypothetical protein